jgi:hypothetical protein
MLTAHMARLIDPSTRRSTAFYAALAIVVWDVYTRGLNVYSAVTLGALAGLGTLGALALAFGGKTPPKE